MMACGINNIYFLSGFEFNGHIVGLFFSQPTEGAYVNIFGFEWRAETFN